MTVVISLRDIVNEMDAMSDEFHAYLNTECIRCQKSLQHCPPIADRAENASFPAFTPRDEHHDGLVYFVTIIASGFAS